MPKREKKLTPAQVETIEKWISAGAKTGRPEPADVPSGMTITSASGHDYRIDPTAIVGVPAVPEPETYALMLAGLGCLGIAARRRQRRAAK